MKRLTPLLWLLAAGLAAAADYPKITLDNGVLSASIYLPDAERGYYRGTRFDWSGIVERVDYAGHRFYAPLRATHDPEGHDSLGGPADEFAMFAPMGFEDAAPGESFVKIGVGLLAKRGDDYRFDGDYPLLEAGGWQVESAADRVSFIQKLTGEHGWAYRYRKRIYLPADKAEMVIEYRLENTGSRTIDITHYNHNFTLIDDTPYGPDYRVTFPFAAAKPRSIDDLARFVGNAIEVEWPLGDRALWAEVYVGEARRDYNAAQLRNQRTGAAISFEGDAPIERMVFWAVERAACPEPFSRIHLRPGEARSWSTRCRFEVDAAN